MGSGNAKQRSDQLTLGYWKMPLKAQPIRYILELGKFKYQENLYTKETAAKWFGDEKQNLGFTYPNMPYIIHGNLKLTESQNLINYAIDVTGQGYLLGEGDQKYHINNIRYLCDELIGKIFQANMKQGDERNKAIETDLLPKFRCLHKDLGSKTQFFCKLSLADVYLYSAASIFKKLFAEAFSEFASTFDPALQKFEDIPEIKAYLASERCIKF